MKGKASIFIIILLILLIAVFAYNYFAEPKANAPTIDENQSLSSDGFQGPKGMPSIKGPTGPPPSNQN